MTKSTFCIQLQWVLCLLALNPLFSQSNFAHRVFMFGNFTDVEDKPAFIQQLDQVFSETEMPFTLILNGDLVNVKIGKYDHQEQIEPILRVADKVEGYPNGNLIIVPGDREWNSSKKGGQGSLGNLENRIKDYLKDKKYDRTHWAVKNGCPGPKVFDMGESLAIITLNTQWWNHPYDKPRPTDAICEGLSEENLKEELEDAVEEYQDRNVLIVGHHPFYSLGNYGGRYSFGDHFKPLPIVGLFTTSFHANAGNQYDLANEHLDPFVSTMKNLFYFHENLIYASAHEHNQQILEGSDNICINSGAPTKAKYAGRNNQTVFSKKAAGIMRLDYYDNGQVDAAFLQNENGVFQQKATRKLFHSSCTEDPVQGEGIIFNTSFAPCKSGARATDQMQFKFAVKATIPGGEGYEAQGMKRFLFGRHYRTTWAEPVTVPYLDLDETYGGLAIYKKGGGRQTTSLKFRSGNGSVYTFRSVDKDPTKALNYILKNTIAAPVVQDFTSTQHPYGAMVVAPLLEEISILHATPTLYRLPDDAKLGPFRKKYGNLFGMLEENPGKTNSKGEHFAKADKIEKSVDMFNRFYKDQDAHLDVEEFVRARLFDILVGDWSKHEDNWKWAMYKTDKGRMYRPIPRDRDHVFSRQDGLINWLADRKFGMQNLEDFGFDFSDIRSLTFQAKHMDRFLMQEAPKSLFMEQAKYIQDHISETDIENAVSKLPPEVMALSGKEVEGKLKNRIKHLSEAAETYYSLLNKEVDVTGSKDEECFEIEHQTDGSVRVRMYDMKNNEKGDKLLYDRTFLPYETKEVRVWGLGDDDQFNIAGNGKKSKIKVSVFGGPGEDIFNDESQAKTLLYDKSFISKKGLKGKGKVVNNWNSNLYEYDRQRFNYNYFLPLFSLGYSSYTGFGIGVSGSWTVRKFEKDDYHSKHKVGLGYTTEGNVRFGYQGRFHQAVRKWDFMVDAFVAQPRLQNRFYGFGNSSENMDDEFGVGYYESAVNAEHISIGLIRDFWQKSLFEIKVGFEQDESERIENTFLTENATDIRGANEQWTMIPWSLKIDLDFRDRKGLPYNGARAVIGYENYSVIDGTTSNFSFGILKGDMEYYMSTKRKHPVTLGLRAGGATSWGAAPWYKLPNLGTNNGLRGFVQNRFTGESTAFFNVELRYQFVEAGTSIVPLKIGLKTFYDFGRVFSDVAVENGDWHNGYGFGFYIVPLNEALTLSLTFGFSEEESVYPVFSVGTPLR